MTYQIEIALKHDLFDAEGEGLRKKARDYFDIDLRDVRTVTIVTIEADLSAGQRDLLQRELFTNPVTQISSYKPLPLAFDQIIWVGYRPGVKDNPGATAVEAIEDILGISFPPRGAVYTSRRYCLLGKRVSAEDARLIACELLANDIIQHWKIFSPKEWNPQEGVGMVVPKVRLDHDPQVLSFGVESDDILNTISDERNLALNPNDVATIRHYFKDPKVRAARSLYGLADPTDIELEYISQARSDHCNHNTFRGLFHYLDLTSGEREEIDNLFKTCIEKPTLTLKDQKPWVISVLWDNAGTAKFDGDHNYVITGETHNSPSNMEAYGGSITGIVGVYRDPLGTGKGARLIMGSYGYCVGPRDYSGDLKPHLAPRRLLDGVIEGVRDGGNKSGIPTAFGQVLFHPSYLGKCLVFVTALGLIPALVGKEPSEKKTTTSGELVIMCGGRVGKDGIHGVTAASESFSENTPAGHVQIGDPYTQKKMHDFLLEARDEGLIRFITDNGGGGLSSSVGESAMFSGGCEIDLEKVPLKYEGLDQWEIWISESQERMTLAVDPDDEERFMQLSARHAVESTVIGRYTESGKLHIRYHGKTCAYVDLGLLESGFPQWEFDAHWQSPQNRGLTEPVFGEPGDYNSLLLDLLSRPNIASKEWVVRQYDHEVQGGSAVKPLVGRDRDMASDAAVIRPVLSSSRGLAFSQALLPFYSAVDAYHMAACTVDEALRRLVAVGADLTQVGGVDNFCWPDIQYHPLTNPDGKFKAAQLVRACKALRNLCLSYEIPLLSGKDSMYVDGHLPGKYNEMHKVSALETLQFSATSIAADVECCVTMEAKIAGDLVYILGKTRDELGASEYYDFLGYTGLNVPEVQAEEFLPLYRALAAAIKKGLTASVHGVYRGGLGIHLAQVAMGGGLGLKIDLAQVPADGVRRDDTLLFSESPGRFIVTIDPDHQQQFEAFFEGRPLARVGVVTQKPRFILTGRRGDAVVAQSLDDLKAAWKKPFGDLI